MPRMLLLSFLLVAGCSKGPEADLQYIKQARSLAAEWALVNQQASAGKLTPAYVGSMHEWLRENLRTARDSLTQPGSSYGREMDSLLGQPDDSPAQALSAHADRLKAIEDSLESA